MVGNGDYRRVFAIGVIGVFGGVGSCPCAVGSVVIFMPTGKPIALFALGIGKAHVVPCEVNRDNISRRCACLIGAVYGDVRAVRSEERRVGKECRL